MGNYFEKTWNLCFLGRLLIGKDKPFIILYQEQISSQRKVFLFGEGEGGEGRGGCLSRLGGVVLPALHVRGFSAAHRDEGVSAWVSPRASVSGCFSRVESFTFFLRSSIQFCRITSVF